jgi:sodium transport system ATP-binding protein
MIATLMKPTSGSITIAGVDAVAQPRLARSKMGFLTGTTKLYDRLTPTEVVKYYADLYGVAADVFERRREALFAQLEISDFAKRRIGKLSTGMRQRVSIARTMIHDPEVIVFDEPTAGLDVLAAQSIVALIRQCREEGKTIIFSTHIMGEVSLLSDDLAIIHRGRLCYSSRYEEFRAQMQGESLEAEFIRILQEEDA